MLAKELKHRAMVFSATLNYGFNEAGRRLVHQRSLQRDAGVDALETILGKMCDRRDRAFNVNCQLHAPVGGTFADLNVSAIASAHALVKLGHLVAKGIEFDAVLHWVEPRLDAVLFPVLAIGLGLKGNVHFSVAKCGVPKGQHPQRLLAGISAGKCFLHLAVTSA